MKPGDVVHILAPGDAAYGIVRVVVTVADLPADLRDSFDPDDRVEQVAYVDTPLVSLSVIELQAAAGTPQGWIPIALIFSDGRWWDEAGHAVEIVVVEARLA